MKRFFIISVFLLGLILLTACSNTPSTDATKETEITTHNHATEDEIPQEHSHIHTTAPYLAPSDVSTKGETEGNVYKNEYLGLTFTKPDNWTFLPEEAVKSRDQAYDMIAVDYTTNASVYLAFENLELTAGNRMTTEEYVENVLKAGVELTPESTITDQTEMTIGSNTYIKVTISTDDHNTPLTKHIYLHSIDKYMVQLTASIPTANSDAVDFDAMLS